MTRLFINIYHYFKGHRLIYWGSLVALFAFFGYFASQIYLEEDLNKLMPSSKNPDGTTKLAFADLKIKDKVFVLFQGKKGTSTDHIAAVCDAFADSLQATDKARGKGHQEIGDIFYQLPEDALYNAIDYMSSHLPAYVDTSAYQHIDSMLTVPHMRAQMQRNYDDLQGAFGSEFPELIQMDPIGIRNILKSQYGSFLQGASGSYKTIGGHFFVPDSTVCIAFITPNYAATNTGKGSDLIVMLNQQIEQFAKTHPDIHISYSGTPANGYDNATTIKKDLVTTIGGSLLLVLIFLMLCFRNWNTIPLLVLPVAFGTIFGLALMYFIKGEFSLLALGIGAIVLGVAMSYVLHVMTHFKYVNDPEKVLQDETKPVLLGCVTTVGSFMGLIFIQTDLLRDFGLFATFAIIGTTLFSLTYLPQMLHPQTNRVNRKVFGWVDKINNYPIDRKKPLLVVLSLVIVICIGAYLIGGTHFDADMRNLGYVNPKVKASETLLREKTATGDKTRYFATSGKTMEEAIGHFATMRAELDSLKRAGLVKSYTHTDQIFVSRQVQEQRIRAWKRFWTPDRLAKVRQLIAATAPAAGLEADGFEPFFDLAQGTYQPDELYKAGILPQGYLSTLMEQDAHGDYLCFTSVRYQEDSVGTSASRYQRICDAIANKPHQLVLDTWYYTTNTLNKLNADFNVLQWISMLFVLVVLFVSFHGNIRYTVLGFMPILLSWLVVLGAMVIFGYKFNLINIIISTFIFGIGVDYSIFVMSGLIGSNENPRLLGYHKTAIFFSAVILIVTVGSMLVAKHPAIQSVGFCTLVGLVSAVIISYVMQPVCFRWLQRTKEAKAQHQ